LFDRFSLLLIDWTRLIVKKYFWSPCLFSSNLKGFIFVCLLKQKKIILVFLWKFRFLRESRNYFKSFYFVAKTFSKWRPWLLFDTRAQFHQRFMNIFYARRSQKCKKIDNLTVIFTHSGSARAKAACKTLMKLSPGVNFTNVLWASFTEEDPESAKKTVKLSVLLSITFRICSRKSCL